MIAENILRNNIIYFSATADIDEGLTDYEMGKRFGLSEKIERDYHTHLSLQEGERLKIGVLEDKIEGLITLISAKERDCQQGANGSNATESGVIRYLSSFFFNNKQIARVSIAQRYYVKLVINFISPINKTRNCITLERCDLSTTEVLEDLEAFKLEISNILEVGIESANQIAKP